MGGRKSNKIIFNIQNWLLWIFKLHGRKFFQTCSGHSGSYQLEHLPNFLLIGIQYWLLNLLGWQAIKRKFSILNASVEYFQMASDLYSFLQLHARQLQVHILNDYFDFPRNSLVLQFWIFSNNIATSFHLCLLNWLLW